ncbi:hypothetical protein FEE95_04460 [Maribacter algarum]|uniref:Uncharacterized protein n=1 Tax=Maribacter algarum (ex Zhang et al. 2020) TaxID=2578118 RepID=A0A5S3PZE2_9FLAO|nr:hypothetical protein [Maribacter algarum]TMM58687.1 hypothetical protein FEE95_04460 [Maribacter algarum]
MSEKTVNVFINQTEISIFKTTIANEDEIGMVEDILNLIVGKNKWNFDLEDIDNILRINANIVVNNFLAQELKKFGFECVELF